MPMPEPGQRTAFVLAGGGSLGAVQVGMLKALTRLGLVPDFVVGASVGAFNGTYFAMEPSEGGVARLERVWLRLRRANVFPLSAASGILALFGRRDHLVTPALLRALIESELPGQKLEDADRKSTRLNSSHVEISYAVFCLKKKKNIN